ncbi:hypothetical protein [Deinococcus pimensis]|uniref:hypothetical protein n=1 Tax=Deinococcus pimensis TaxID=309888 RepID=UPI0004838CFC|nr:hypothetical protein [Deinococcus pimensis]
MRSPLYEGIAASHAAFVGIGGLCFVMFVLPFLAGDVGAFFERTLGVPREGTSDPLKIAAMAVVVVVALAALLMTLEILWFVYARFFFTRREMEAYLGTEWKRQATGADARHDLTESIVLWMIDRLGPDSLVLRVATAYYRALLAVTFFGKRD